MRVVLLKLCSPVRGPALTPSPSPTVSKLFVVVVVKFFFLLFAFTFFFVPMWQVDNGLIVPLFLPTCYIFNIVENREEVKSKGSSDKQELFEI